MKDAVGTRQKTAQRAGPTRASRRDRVFARLPEAQRRRNEIRQLLQTQPVQPKLKIGSPNDTYEREADEVAERMTSMTNKEVSDGDHSNVTAKMFVKQQSRSRYGAFFPYRSTRVAKTNPAKRLMRQSDGESWLPDISNLGIGTIDNKTKKSFQGNASSGKEGTSNAVLIGPGEWGDKKPILGPGGMSLNDIDFVFPTKITPINGKTDGAFKIGSNDVTLVPDPKNPSNSIIDDYSDYWPPEKANSLIGYPKQESKQPIQRMVIQHGRASDEASVHIAEVEEVLNSDRGRSLDEATRTHFEHGFAHDFRGVRIHTDFKAGQSAEMINARAYTFGEHIVFGPGQYNPVTLGGKKLLAHELTHVVQQRYSRATTVRRKTEAPNGRAEAIKRDDFLRRLAQKPTDALYLWRRLNSSEKTVLVTYMAMEYGLGFAKHFYLYASTRRDPERHVLITNLVSTTPEKLTAQGYRLAETSGRMQIWVHPSNREVWRFPPSVEVKGREQPEGEPAEAHPENPSSIDLSIDPETLFGPVIASRADAEIMGARGRAVQYVDGTIQIFGREGEPVMTFMPRPGPGNVNAYDMYGQDGHIIHGFIVPIVPSTIFGSQHVESE